MRRVVSVVAVIALCCAAGCTGKSSAPPPPVRSASPSPAALPSGTTSLDCTGPIDSVAQPTAPERSTLGVVALDTESTLQASSTGGTDPHGLFAKVGLLVHVGRESTLTVRADWAARVSIAWGNHAPEWTTSLHIPACPAQKSAPGQWLVFPGGFSLDKAACVPLEVHAAGETTTVIFISVGTRCRD